MSIYICSYQVVTDTSGNAKGFGFVRFGSREEQEQCLATMTGVMCGSRPIRVSPATAKKPGALGTMGLFHLSCF